MIHERSYKFFVEKSQWINSLRNFNISQGEESKRFQNSSSISSLQNNFVLLQQSPEVNNRESFRQQQSQIQYLPPHSKYIFEHDQNVQSHRDKTEVRDIRIIQNQLEIAKSTIDTLKEELNVLSL